jgi:hypothetical protein
MSHATWHRVGPLLHAALKHAPAGAVPPDVLDALAREFNRTAARNLRAAAGCQMISSSRGRRLSQCRSNPTLAVTAYGSWPRMFGRGRHRAARGGPGDRRPDVGLSPQFR